MQAKLIAAAIVAMLLIGSGLLIRKLHADTVEQRITLEQLSKQLQEQEAALKQWEGAYAKVLTEMARVQGIVGSVEEQRDQNAAKAKKLAKLLEEEKKRDKCAQAAVPDSYLDVLVGGLPSHREAVPAPRAAGGNP